MGSGLPRTSLDTIKKAVSGVHETSHVHWHFDVSADWSGQRTAQAVAGWWRFNRQSWGLRWHRCTLAPLAPCPLPPSSISASVCYALHSASAGRQPAASA